MQAAFIQYIFVIVTILLLSLLSQKLKIAYPIVLVIGELAIRKIYLEVLDKQRLLLLELNKNADTDEEIIRGYQNLLDMEEEMLRMRYERV